MDTRQLVKGTTLYLPVQVAGALFSTGDAHGCQGDGEICVTGLEAPMYATMRFRVEKRSIPAPAVPHRARPAHARRRRRLVLRHHRRRRRPVRERAERDPRDDRPPRRRARPLARGRLRALLARRRPEDQRDRRRRRSSSSPPSCRRRSSRSSRSSARARPAGPAWRSGRRRRRPGPAFGQHHGDRDLRVVRRGEGDEPGGGVLGVLGDVGGGDELGRAGLAGDGDAGDRGGLAGADRDDGDHHVAHLAGDLGADRRACARAWCRRRGA